MQRRVDAGGRWPSTNAALLTGHGAADLRINKLHGAHMVRVSSDHNLRTKHCPYLGTSKILNHASAQIDVLHGSTSPQDVAAAALHRREQAGVKRLRKNQVVALEILVTLRPLACDDEAGFFQGSLAWVAEVFGGWPNILTAVVHHDEAAPHMHALVIPVIGNRMNGSALVGGPGRLRALRDSFQSEVCVHHRVSMPAGALRGEGKLKATFAVLRRIELDDDPVMQSCIWMSVQELVKRDPRPFLQDLGIDHEQFRPTRRLRSMTQIFISAGKGSRLRSEGDAA